ncbi:MAG: ParB/RepB/Spo0J family partition protein [Candidatus Limnocylindrales bacterium]
MTTDEQTVATDVRRVSGGLGRGLTSLIPTASERPREVLLAEITRNPYQPRAHFDESDLASLAASVAEHGVLQPILVTQVPGGYQLVAGERRVRAAEMAGLDRVPAVIRTVAQQQQLALALVENLQRSDLNAMDAARAFRQLADDFGLTQEQIAAQVGRSRPAVANTLRLLEASPAVQAAVEDGRITEGHARAIVGLATHDAQDQLLRQVIGRALSVRQTEAVARDHRDKPASGVAPVAAVRAADVERVEATLRIALGTKVTLAPGRRGGRITIEYYDDDDLERIYERLTRAER